MSSLLFIFTAKFADEETQSSANWERKCLSVLCDKLCVLCGLFLPQSSQRKKRKAAQSENQNFLCDNLYVLFGLTV